MASAPRRSRRIGALLLLVLAAGAMAGVAAEGVLRVAVGPPTPLGRLGYATKDGQPITPEQGVQRGLIVPVPPPVTVYASDRPRMMFAPSQDFFLCYTDNDRLRRSWMDAQGRVGVHINAFGLRERDDLQPAKPAGQQRIVCIGDSFTFGWGIPDELGWVRLLENELRQGGRDVRTVNCGASGTVCIDEYVTGLQQRFHVFQPDAVILTICLNDLFPNSGLSVQDPVPTTGSRLIDLARAVFGRSALDLDPRRDWVQELLELPRDQAEESGMAGANSPYDAMWSQGTPQKALRGAHQWCSERKIPFLVVLWPFLQGLGPGRHYPFQKMHDLVAADCKAAGIPFLDVLPALRSTDQEQLWVTPDDPHANPLAQTLALPAITAFVRQQTGW